MATKKRPSDPAQAANERILADRQDRIEKQMREIPDLGLKLPEADTPAEFLRDQFDKEAFGDPMQTVSRTVYGPHPLVDHCPDFKVKIHQYGKLEMAERYRRVVLEKGALALPDAVMQKSLHRSIVKFGPEVVAQAFYDQVMSIPEREVQYESGAEEFGDPELLGDAVLRDCVRQYERPGMSYRFLSQRGMDLLGMRHYKLIVNEKGDPVKAGSLFLAEIPLHIAQQRQQRYVRESQDKVAIQEDEYLENQEREVRKAGRAAAGSRPLATRETFTASASENREEALGQEFSMGVDIRRG